jgi:oligopeptide transport system substrate-binding protein
MTFFSVSHVSVQRTKLAAAAALLALSALNATAAIVPSGVALAAKQELVRNNGSEVETLDPALVETVVAANVSRDLFESLTATDSDGKVVPGVAEKWEQKDSTTWIFHLRKNARWSNGDPVIANDFVYGCQRFVDPKTASSYANVFGPFLLNGADIVAGKKPASALGVRAVDANTIEVKTDGLVPFLPELMSNPNLGPVHRATVEKFGKDWTKPGNLVSNGAFQLKDWQVNSKLVLTKNSNYWDKTNVQLTQVTYLPVEDENTDVKLFQSGENDMTYQLPTGTYAKYSQQFPKDIRNSLILGTRYYSFNNRDLLPKGVSGAEVSNYEWSTWPMAKRVEEAKKLLEQAGVKPGTKLSFAMNTSDYNKKMAIFVASEWKTKLGLTMDIESMEFKVLLKKRHGGDYQIARSGWVADYNDATTFLTLVQCKSEQNDSFSCNPKADALIKEAAATTDLAKRTQLQTQAAKIVMDDYPMLPLLQYGLPRLVKSYVGGYSLKNPMDHYGSKDLYIVKH